MAVARTKALCSQLTDPERNKGNAPSADELQELVNTLQSDEESLKHTRAALLELRKNLAARKGRRTMLALQSLQHLAQHSSMTVRAQMVELKVLNAVAKLCSSNTGPLGTKPSPDIVDKAKELIIEWSHFPQPQFERMLQELQSKGVRFPDSMDENHDEHYQSEYELSEEDRNAIEQAIREDEHLQRQQQREISQQQQQPVVTATAAAAAFPSQDASIATADQFLTGTRSKAGLHEDISTAMDTIALLYDQMREGANSGSIDEDTLVAVQQQVQVIQQRAAKLVQAIDDEALLSTLLDVNDQSEKALSTYSMWRSGQSVPELQPEHSDAFPAQNAPAKMDDFDLLMAPAESTAGIGSNQQQAGAHQQQNWSHSDPLQELLASSNMSHGKGKAQAPNHPQSYSSDPFESLSTTPPSTQPCMQPLPHGCHNSDMPFLPPLFCLIYLFLLSCRYNCCIQQLHRSLQQVAYNMNNTNPLRGNQRRKMQVRA